MKQRFFLDGGIDGPVFTVLRADTSRTEERTINREKLLEEHRATPLRKLSFKARVFLSGKNKNHVILNEEELPDFAKSFEGMPFLRDHASEFGARAGTILKSELQPRGDKQAIVQELEAVKGWAIESFLDGTLDRFSIGWDAEQYICTACKKDFMDCGHMPWDLGRTDKESGEVVEVLMKGLTGAEVSAVTHPAVSGTGIEALCALKEKQFAAPISGVVNTRGEEQMKERLYALLSLPANTEEADALTALEKRLSAPSPALLQVLSMSSESTAEQVLAKAVALTAPGLTVSVEEHTKTVSELKKLRAQIKVGEMKSAGKITPAHEKWALELAENHPEAFDAFFKSAQVQIPITPAPIVLSTDVTVPDASKEDDVAVFVRGRFGVTVEERLAVVKDEEHQRAVWEGRA